MSSRGHAAGPAGARGSAQRLAVRMLREVVDVAARQLIGERGEGDSQVDGAPDSVAP